MTKKILLSLMLVALFASCIRERWDEDNRQFIVRVGDKVDLDFEMELFRGGKVNLADYTGRVILIQFATYYCEMTQRKMGHIEPQIWQKHKPNPNFKLLAIARGSENTPENIENILLSAVHYFTGATVTYPIAMDPNRDFFARFAQRDGGATRDILIGKDGHIEKLTRFFSRDGMAEFNELVARIDELLAD